MTRAPFLHPVLLDHCRRLVAEFPQIPPSRRALLQQLATYLLGKFRTGNTPRVNVICTHNSRRSHMGQFWLAAGADFFGLPELQSFSGGTEATAFHPRAVTALRELGFVLEPDSPGPNPVYTVRWNAGGSTPPYRAFSKVYSAPPNPDSDFAAVLVCTEADAGCPVVLGSDFRLALPFEDPKVADGTPYAAERYRERARDIGREFLYCLNDVCQQLKTDADPVPDCTECVAI